MSLTKIYIYIYIYIYINKCILKMIDSFSLLLSNYSQILKKYIKYDSPELFYSEHAAESSGDFRI